MSSQATIKRDPAAFKLSEEMLRRDDVMREILRETIRGANAGEVREAGRTKCPQGEQIRGPLGRFSKAINLYKCPEGEGGVWHTHVTPAEIQTPENSLPDMANVIYGLTNASIVVGTQSADVVIAPEDPLAARNVFESVIGVKLDGPSQLVDEIASGRVVPAATRRRVRERMGELFYTAETGFGEVQRELDTIEPRNWATQKGSGRNEAFSGNKQTLPAVETANIEAAATEMSSKLEDLEIGQLVISTAIGSIVGEVVNKVLLGED
jgi:hypothetical protein